MRAPYVTHITEPCGFWPPNADAYAGTVTATATRRGPDILGGSEAPKTPHRMTLANQSVRTYHPLSKGKGHAMANVKDRQDPTVRAVSRTRIDDIRRALHAAESGADVDAIERRLDAMQAELRVKWTAAETSGSSHRQDVCAGMTLGPRPAS